MKVLIIEDDIKISQTIQQHLSRSGFIVDVSYDGEDGLFKIKEHLYQLILLDVGLPLRNGFSVLTEIRKINKDVYVLMLTARDAVEDRVRGLDLGADDYLIKPFSFAELLARIQSRLRRPIQQQQEQLSIADLTIDFKKRKVIRQNQLIDLTAKEFSLLTLLVERTGQVLTRTFISELVWDIHFDCDSNIIDVAIKRLRQKVDHPFEKKLIHTIRGVGYVLEQR